MNSKYIYTSIIFLLYAVSVHRVCKILNAMNMFSTACIYVNTKNSNRKLIGLNLHIKNPIGCLLPDMMAKRKTLKD